MFEIVVVEGRGEGRRWPIPVEGILIGRSPTCQIHIPDVLLSRKHCELRSDGVHVYMRDLGSRNAVLVNGVAVREALVSPGDRITCARTTLELRESDLATSLEFGTTQEGTDPSQSTLRLGDAIFVSDAIEVDHFLQDPEASAMIAQLFQLTRTLGRQRDTASLLEVTIAHLRTQLRPAAWWFTANLGPDDDLALHPLCHGQSLQLPVDLVRQAQAERVGVLSARRVRVGERRRIESTVVAPILVAGEVLGALTLAVQTPEGAYDEMDLQYLFAVSDVLGPIYRAVEQAEQLQRDLARLGAQGVGESALVGSSEIMNVVRCQIASFARSRQHVLVLGETGTGKELAARLLHDQSPRAHGPFVALNCAAIPNDLFESEVFGHVRGAFTGAHQARVGLFQQAHGGTLFLDEVAELTPENQARLLRTVESGSFRRVGDDSELHADVRIVAATNRDVRSDVGKGGLREDLYYRLGGTIISLPPLRARREDIPELIEVLVARCRASAHLPEREFTPASIERLMQHDWPGNVRELRNVIERACVLASGRRVGPEDFSLISYTKSPVLRSLDEVERQHITQTLIACSWNTAETAAILGVARSTLYNKINQYGLSPK